ncbi:unnamed protein product [Thelazia callipaeda]|uniref:Fanconi-associated nuclease n=1 Tax=Thelazia callipaeda TaxID=103827 RepID=A0A0N5CZH5_THECL|nr:unnamed protein product [Thelazia callipaeda]
MKKCLTKLEELRSGKLLSHQLLPETENFMADVILRKVRLLLKCGHIEKAIGMTQAVCEFNLCVPQLPDNASLSSKRSLFAIFWDSGMARMGDENAKGWNAAMEYIKKENVTTDMTLCVREEAEYDDLETRLCQKMSSTGLKSSHQRIWIEVEKLRTKYQWRPIRDVFAKVVDKNRIVTFKDIEDVLYSFNKIVAVTLFLNLMEELGAKIYGWDSLSPTNIMHEFTLFPDFSVGLKDIDKFLNRCFDLVSVQVEGQVRDLVLSSQLLTIFNLISRNYGSREKITAKFREEAKLLCCKNNNIRNLSLVATLAEKLLELGKDEIARTCVNKFFVSNDMWSEKEMSRLVPMLRMAIVYISAAPDDFVKRDLISTILCEGKCVQNEVKDINTIQNRINVIFRDLLRREGMHDTWEGSPIDLISCLVLFYSYYFVINEKRVWSMRKCYMELSAVTRHSKHRRLLKKYLELLQLHVTLNPGTSRRVLVEALITACRRNPTDVSILKMYIDSTAKGNFSFPVKKFLETNSDDENTNYYFAFGSVYLELLRHRILLDNSDNICSPGLHRLRTVLKRASERVKHTVDVFWRLLLQIENDQRNVQRSREVFYLAFAECPWSKALCMDYKYMDSDEYAKLLDVLVEKHLRLRCEHDEIAILMRE